MRTTLRHLPMKKITVQYPEQREELPERSRGLFRVDHRPGDRRTALPLLHAVREQLSGAGDPRQFALEVRAAGAQRGAHARGRGSSRSPSPTSSCCSRSSTTSTRTAPASSPYSRTCRTLWLSAAPRAAGRVTGDRRVALADLRRGELLQPVPPLADRQVPDRRLPRHRLPRGRSRPDHQRARRRARHRLRQDHEGHDVHARLGAPAWAPARRRRSCASASRRSATSRPT